MRNAYWDLVYAIQAVEAAQNSLDLAARLVQDNQSRVEIGTLAPIDVVSAQAEEATRRHTLVQAQATVRTAELALKRLIVSGTEDPLWTSSINPVDRPSTTPEPINLEAAVTRALASRTDLQQSKNNLKISDINLHNQVDAHEAAAQPDRELRPERARRPVQFSARDLSIRMTGVRPTTRPFRPGTSTRCATSRLRCADVDGRVHLRLSARARARRRRRWRARSCRCSRPRRT